MGTDPLTERERRAATSVLRQAVRQYLIWSAITLVVVAVGTAYLSARIAHSEALREAERIGRAVATGIVAPLVTADARRGEPGALEELDRVVQSRVADGSITRVKVWDPGGRVVYSDDARLIGRSFELGRDDLALVGTMGTQADLSSLDRDENEYERASGELVEVYAAVPAADGSPVLVETYLPAERIQAMQDHLTGQLQPFAIIALAIFQALMLPLAIKLARRVDRGQQERRRLLQHAVRASDLERRRVAQDLHDGVLQDLAGVTYALTSLSTQLHDRTDADPAARTVLGRATAVLQRDVTALRGLLKDIYPPDLLEHGLVQAVASAVEDSRRHGLDASLETPADVEAEMAPETAALAFRVVREALRNVAKHAGASRVRVRLERLGPALLRVIVDDDGCGMDPQVVLRRDGHFGLRVLADTIRDTGGRFSVGPRIGGGTSVEAVLTIAG